MKNIYILLIIGLFMFAGCSGSSGNSVSSPPDNGKLTTEKAQITLTRWVSEGQVEVRGIQDSGNAAQADITFTDFHFTLRQDGVPRNYSGPGTAIFKHYNDGRWVLTNVSTSQGYKSIRWDNLNVEVY
jgi:hypothetical protein